MRAFQAPTQSAVGKSAAEGSNDSDRYIGFWLLGIIGGGVILVVLLIRVDTIWKNRPAAMRANLFLILDEAQAFMRTIEPLSKHEALRPSTRARIAEAKVGLARLKQVTSTPNVSWSAQVRAGDSFLRELESIISTARTEASTADRAKTEGPKLLEAMPARLQAVAEQIAQGKASPEAQRKLQIAREQLAQAQRQAESGGSGLSYVDWIMIYMLLSSSQESCTEAQYSHHSFNQPEEARVSPGWQNASRSETASPGTSDFGGGDIGSGGGATGEM